MTSCAHCPELRRLRKQLLHQQRIIETVRCAVAKRRLPKQLRATLQNTPKRPQAGSGGPNGTLKAAVGRGGVERPADARVEACPC